MIDRIKRDAECYLSESRYNHTLGVMNEAIRLAERYGEDREKAAVAALLHDLGKSKRIYELLKLDCSSDIILEENLKKNGALYHAVASRMVAERRYSISDSDILNAVRYHTTGRPNMTNLEKIVYLADYIEPGRDFPGVEEMRKISYEDLDRAMLCALENTIVHVVSNGQILHEDTVRSRNYILARLTKLGVKK
ncbi:putative nicotinate-nucleotide adenylyltransferase [Andreesenia angusta]|uniref:bis(5'-nucleosyl)-tetraphosphatase (symmetrical) n=1 Tax=Andreesenia angusta TaxID=39480 RepID=A0A1S1V7W8_9FIRM|nr:bis(5'-nucleosyl)-tetraphosphatase (symmetrical) YqeK [Andreesenia angusta]OHW62515.1 putative nicotinate-nucleotide adenylyltransferase [Andreesenia angusta]